MFFWKKRPKTQVAQQVKAVEFDARNIEEILEYIKRSIGIDLFVKKSILETRLKSFAQKNGLDSFGHLYQTVLDNSAIRQDLINLLTVNETYFYRESRQLHEAIDFACKIKNAKILCAPCASGEEAYSLAMLMSEREIQPQQYSIMGIDINTQAIQKAKQGIYSQRALHKFSDSWRQKYFMQEGDYYSIKPQYFSAVSFAQMNIFDNSFLSMGAFDILFSRNMLIYFDEDTRLKAAQRFAQLLKPSGRLYLGHADIVPPNSSLTKSGYGSSSYYTANI